MKKVLSIVLTFAVAITMFVLPSSAASIERTTAEFKAEYAVAEGEYKVTENVTITDKFNFQENAVIDLGGNTLTLTVADSDVTADKTVEIKNGSIVLNTNSAGDGIIHVGIRGGAAGTLILSNVDVIGDNISSGAGTFMVYGASTLRLINGTTVTVTNEVCSAAYIIYCNSGIGATVEIITSKIISTGANSGLYSGTIIIKSSELELDVKDNGINSLENGMNLTAENSDIIIENGNGRALTIFGTSTASFVNSTFTSVDNAEAAIRFKSGSTGKISADKASVITMEGTTKLVVDDVETVSAQEYTNYIETENNVTVAPDGTVIIKAEAPVITETPASTSTTHEHYWGYNTQYDAAAHWDYCHVCGAQNTAVAHSDANGDGICECGWILASTPSRVNPNTGVTAEMLK